MAAKYPDFGKWLTYQEGIASATARKYGLDNTPTQQQYDRMKLVYQYIYAPLCEHYGMKLPINSFFRSKAVNGKLPNASKTSEHMAGGAIDIDCRSLGKVLTNDQLFEFVRTGGVPFDQLIFEAPGEGNVCRWVHIAYRPESVGGNRKRVMRMQLDGDGKAFYQYWPWGKIVAVGAWLLGALAAGIYYYSQSAKA